MKECDNCIYGEWLNGKEVITETCLECRYICGEPSKWREKIKTNAEHIRAMSDEELAEFISHCGCPDHAQDCKSSCKDCTLEWLKQSVEDVDDG